MSPVLHASVTGMRSSSVPGSARADVFGLLEAADELLGQLAPRIDTRRLMAELPLPTCPPDEERTGLTWLIGTYGHSREHVGQIQLTIQLRSGRDLTHDS